MSRTPTTPAPRYTLAEAARHAARIRDLRIEALDPDLNDVFPAEVIYDDDIDAVIDYLHNHHRVSPLIRAAELKHRSALLEYQRQRDTARRERLLLAMLEDGHQLGVPPRIYGEPMGLRSRQAVYDRRTRLARRRPATAGPSLGDQGRAQQWLDENAAALHTLADILIDHRDTLLLLVDEGVARSELAHNIDEAGRLMASRRPSLEFCGAVAYAVSGLRPAVARQADDPILREHIARGLHLLWDQ